MSKKKNRKLKLNFFHNAFFSLEDINNRLIFDPWVTQGILDSGWYTPRILSDDFFDDGKENYIFCSHPHEDHFDVDFLKNQNAPIHVPIFNRASTMGLKRCGKNINLLTPFEWIQCGTFQITCTPGLNGIDFDSTFLVKHEDANFYFGSDNSPKNKILLRKCRDIIEKIDIAAMNYSRADDHPGMFFNLTNDEKKEERKKGLYTAFNVFFEAAEILQPKVIFPCAGDYIVRGNRKDIAPLLKICAIEELIKYAKEKLLSTKQILDLGNYSSWNIGKNGNVEFIKNFTHELSENKKIPDLPWYQKGEVPREINRK